MEEDVGGTFAVLQLGDDQHAGGLQPVLLALLAHQVPHLLHLLPPQLARQAGQHLTTALGHQFLKHLSEIQ